MNWASTSVPDIINAVQEHDARDEGRTLMYPEHAVPARAGIIHHKLIQWSFPGGRCGPYSGHSRVYWASSSVPDLINAVQEHDARDDGRALMYPDRAYFLMMFTFPSLFAF